MDPLRRGRRLLTGQNDGEADQDGHDDDLEHDGLGHGLNDVGGEHIDQGLHGRHALSLLKAQSGRLQYREKARKNTSARQADHNGEGRRAEVVDHGPQTDDAHLADITHGNDAVDDGKQHDRHHDKLEQIQKDRAERPDIGFRQVSVTLQGQACEDPQQQGDEDLGGQGQFYLFFFLMFHPSLS